MPIYDLICEDCGEFEHISVIQGGFSVDNMQCPKCKDKKVKIDYSKLKTCYNKSNQPGVLRKQLYDRAEWAKKAGKVDPTKGASVFTPKGQERMAIKKGLKLK